MSALLFFLPLAFHVCLLGLTAKHEIVIKKQSVFVIQMSLKIMHFKWKYIRYLQHMHSVALFWVQLFNAKQHLHHIEEERSHL